MDEKYKFKSGIEDIRKLWEAIARIPELPPGKIAADIIFAVAEAMDRIMVDPLTGTVHDAFGKGLLQGVQTYSIHLRGLANSCKSLANAGEASSGS
ncbi:MAG: hypothetical protein JWO38_7115 [Gemmataceae bacterium]|nr:hypothetical protein [Gemmataceae bacterium]